ncbi:MAG: serine/threonine-protein kinase [Anaerolineae bacterium]|jgi:serine/threonine-protein kinase|nr:serine/threonine-protein kinase [Anaerolineae bacterium]
MRNLVGKDIGAFRIKSIVGEGGSSIVYEAEYTERSDARCGRRVALKVVRTDKGASDLSAFNDWLENEVDLLRSARHPGIVRMFPFQTADNQYGYIGTAKEVEGWPLYFAMELLNKTSLRDVISRSNNFTGRWKVEVLYQVISALSYLHGKEEFAHRDLKPENVMFRDDPQSRTVPTQPVLIDFGLAGVDHQDAATYPYASPEYLRYLYMLQQDSMTPRPKLSWARYDIYSMGVIAYEMFNGNLPYEGMKADSSLNETYKLLEQGRRREMNAKLKQIRSLSELISDMTSPNAADRPTADQTLDWLDTEVLTQIAD